jgi:hypothetical protein
MTRALATVVLVALCVAFIVSAFRVVDGVTALYQDHLPAQERDRMTEPTTPRDPLHGIAWPMASGMDATVPYVERDDEMGVYGDDIAAARVVAEHTGTPLMFIVDHDTPAGEELHRLRPFVLSASILAALSIDSQHAAVPVGILERCARLADAENERICGELSLDPGEIGPDELRALEILGDVDAETVDSANEAYRLARTLYAASRGESVDWSKP